MDETNNAAPAGKSNMMWYVIGGIVVVVLIGGYLASNAGGFAMKAAGVNVQQGANGSVTYTGAEGSATVGGASMPSNWPSDAPTNYSSASIQYSGTSNPTTGQTGTVVMYTAKASAASVDSYYKSELAKNGWTIEGTMNTGAAGTIISAKKDTRTLGIAIADAGDGTVSVTVGIEL